MMFYGAAEETCDPQRALEIKICAGQLFLSEVLCRLSVNTKKILHSLSLNFSVIVCCCCCFILPA